MFTNADRDIIYNAYTSYSSLCKNKLGSINQSKAISLRAQISEVLEKSILFLNSKATTELERIRYVNKIKNAYIQYCYGLKANPDFFTDKLKNKMEKALLLASDFEEKRIQILRMQHIAGERIDLGSIFNKASNIRTLVIKMADKIVEEALEDNSYTIVGKNTEDVYITANGSKYHKKDCPYCKGRILKLSTKKEVENLNLMPCLCLQKNTTPPKKEESFFKKENMINSSEYITVFVDESVRSNLWSDIDVKQSKTYGVFSYIICNGYLQKEEQISSLNTICEEVSVIKSPKGPETVTICAITDILSKLLSLGYKENVIIYTDNKQTKDNWHDKKENQNLASYFLSVKVQHIPRECNKKADNLGRKSIFMEVTEEFAKQILAKCKVYDEIKKQFT